MSDPAHIVIIEDDEGSRKVYTRCLSKLGHTVAAFPEAPPAFDYLREHRDVALVVTDLMLPGIDGFGVLKSARQIDPNVGVLMITGHASIESAVEAIKLGADHYLKKPVDLEEFRIQTASIIEKRRLTQRVEDLERRLSEKFGRLIGRSKPMEALIRQMDLVAPTRSSVLIVGESGTGKELVANAIHENSPRRDARFLPINCAAIPAEILESELFGHERGSFTGAVGRKLGKFELADKGTLFLDEIGELPLEMQVKLLRVLEEREFMRVGGTDTIHVDIRLIAATNADLEAAVNQGRFRSDLYYRLKVVTLRIPPLRERREDILHLVDHFLRQFARENHREGMRFAPDAMKVLYAAPWEGNVRELRNVVESLVVLAPAEEISVADLPEEYQRYAEEAAEAGRVPAAAGTAGTEGIPAGSAGLTMEEIERRAILGALEQTGGNRTQAADMLGIGLRTLQRKLKEYRLAGRESETPQP
jgi:two-component system, NtrC family, response regulator HydG